MSENPPEPEREPTSLKAKRLDAIDRIHEACLARFAGPGFAVELDDRGTVWVRRSDGSRSVGLSPWLLRTRSTAEVLERAELKLGFTADETGRGADA
jgi:hypothetical protein